MAHFAHYIRRTISLSPGGVDNVLPYVENQTDDQGFERPLYHSVPKSSGAASRAKEGDTFWLFSQLRTPWGKLLPSLDARIVVKSIAHTGLGASARTRFTATETSEWFPIFDASTLLSSLLSRNAEGECQPLLSLKARTVGQALRFPREISNVEELISHCNSLNSTPIDFVSYRMVDGTRAAFELVDSLTRAGKSVFWDRWSLPRRMSERGERLCDFSLDIRIQQAIFRSRRVWGVETPGYAVEGSYSLLEKALATTLRKFEPYRPHMIPNPSVQRTACGGR